MVKLSVYPTGGKKILLLLLAIAVIVTVAGCGLLDEFEKQVAADIKDNPVVVQYIGDINSIETDWTATGEEPDENTFVFRISGTKGEGMLTAECITIDADHEDVVSGSLELASGETIDLFR